MKTRKRVTKKSNESQITQEKLDKMAFYFLLMCSELIERDFRKDLDKVIERVKQKYPQGWSSD